MKIYDCFQFFDENMMLDLRLNVLNEYVDHFVIVESKYKHNGDTKNKNFDIDQFSKFKKKITYIYNDKEPDNLISINLNDNENTKTNYTNINNSVNNMQLNKVDKIDIINAVDEKIKTVKCKKESKRGCNGKSIKCITHDLWDDLESHINNFFENGLQEMQLQF